MAAGLGLVSVALLLATAMLGVVVARRPFATWLIYGASLAICAVASALR